MRNIVFFSLFDDFEIAKAPTSELADLDVSLRNLRLLAKNKGNNTAQDDRYRQAWKNKITRKARKYSASPYNSKYRQAKQALDKAMTAPPVSQTSAPKTAVAAAVNASSTPYIAPTRKLNKANIATGLGIAGLAAGGLYMYNRNKEQENNKNKKRFW